MEKLIAELLYNHLYSLRYNHSKVRVGLCDYLNMCIGTHRNARTGLIILQEWMKEWSEYSGDPQYPVSGLHIIPDNNSPKVHMYAYQYAYSFKLMYTGLYGEARLRLVSYLMQRLAEVARIEYKEFKPYSRELTIKI